MTDLSSAAFTDPAAATVAALTDHISTMLHAKAAKTVAGTFVAAAAGTIEEAIEGSELLAQFEADIARAAAAAVRGPAVDEAVVEAVADLVYPIEPELQFDTLDAFVTGYITRVFRRDVVNGREYIWCPRWFEHEPAVVTLTGLWLSFEVLRKDPGTGPAVWQRDYLLPLMNALTSPSGPLVGCKATKHSQDSLPPLPCDPTPPGLFDTTPAEVSNAVRAHGPVPDAAPAAGSDPRTDTASSLTL